MTSRSLLAVVLCAALPAPSLAQVRVSIGNAPSGVSVIPSLGIMASPMAPSLDSALSAPSIGGTLSAAPVPALTAVPVAVPRALSAAPQIAAAAPVALVPVAGPFATAKGRGTSSPYSSVAAVQPVPSVAVVKSAAVASLSPERSSSESFWSGAAAKADLDDAVPVSAKSPARSGTFLARGAAVLAPAALSVPHWVSVAAPYAGGVGVLAGAYALTRVARWAVAKAAARLGWDKNAVVMARFISSVVLWSAGAGAALAVLGVSGTTLIATFGAGGTAMALAITLAVRDVAGNLFHGVHFLLARPFTVGDKVTIGKTTGVVHDLTLRYIVLKDETGGYILYTYNVIAAAPVKLYGEYKTKEFRLALAKPAFPRGLLRALRDAASPTLWKPILFSALAIAALSFFPMLQAHIKGTSASWLVSVLPYVKAALVAVLTSSISRSLKAGAERLAARYGWSRPMTAVAKLALAGLAWAVGGSFLLHVLGVSWAWVAGTLSLSTVLVSIAVNDYVSAVFQGSLVLTLKPFRIGDRVTIGENAGTVVDITLQYVVLKLDGESFMLIPHSVVKDSAIVTPREYGQRRK